MADKLEWTVDISIPESDRVKNKKPLLNWNSPYKWNADWIMRIFDKLVDGQYEMRMSGWVDESARPSPKEKIIGINLRTGGFEWYTSIGWKTFGGTWNTGQEPTNVVAGSIGWDIDLGHLVVFNGNSWEPLNV